MITCDLIGRMGNQMFQIATTAAHAWRVGKPFAFPDTAQGSYTGETYFHHLPKVRRGAFFPKYTERSHRYNPIPANLTNVKLHGYWQSEKYFKEYRDQVSELFAIKPVWNDADYSIHLRFGDYLEFSDKHPPVTLKYITAAISSAHKQYETKFMVFSDDVKRAENLIEETNFQFKGCKFDYCAESDPKKSLALMAGCENNIIANSSFSWWGAWLNPNPEKIVIAPKVWFGPGNSHLDPTDIYCENWIVL